MTVQTFRDLLTRRPFQPVRLTLSNGQSIEIRQPGNAFLTRSCIVIGVEIADYDGIPAELKSSRSRTSLPRIR
jgi:hypothetical protein